MAEQHGGSDPRRDAGDIVLSLAPCRVVMTRRCPISGCGGRPCARFEDDDESRWTGAPWALGMLLMDPPPGRWAGFEPAPVPRVGGAWSEVLD